MPRVIDEVAPVGVGGAPDGQDRLRRRVDGVVRAARPREVDDMRPVGAEVGPYFWKRACSRGVAGDRDLTAHFGAASDRGAHRRCLRGPVQRGRGAPRLPRELLQLGDEERGRRRADRSSRGDPADYVYSQRRHEVVDLAQPRDDDWRGARRGDGFGSKSCGRAARQDLCGGGPESSLDPGLSA